MRGSRVLALGSTLLLSGCFLGVTGKQPATAASAQAPGAEAAADEEQGPLTVEEAEVDVQLALVELKRFEGERKHKAHADTSATTASSKEAASPECQAFNSLERATIALCNLAGTQDARCKRAQQAVQKYWDKISCP